jgi:L-amino acid N-acyltransferase YncA
MRQAETIAPAAEAPGPAVLIRVSTDADLAAMHAIYHHHVTTGLASFEEEPPSAEDFASRRAAVVGLGLPWLAAEEAGGTVVGYAYAGLYRPRSGYRYTLEDSVYLAAGATGRGIGRALVRSLVAEATALGYRQMVAVIGDSANAASIAMHRACGFSEVGVLRGVGFKFGRWVNSVLMQRPLGDGGLGVPAAPPRHLAAG